MLAAPVKFRTRDRVGRQKLNVDCILRCFEQDVAALVETADQPVDRSFIVTGEANFLAELLIPVAIEIGTDPGRAALSVEILTARLDVEISGPQGQRPIIPQRSVRFCADPERKIGRASCREEWWRKCK